jgi:hypothetical protein
MDQIKEEKKNPQEKKQQPKQRKLEIPVILTLLVPIDLPDGLIQENADVSGTATTAFEDMTKEQQAQINSNLMNKDHMLAIELARALGESYILQSNGGRAFINPLAIGGLTKDIEIK